MANQRKMLSNWDAPYIQSLIRLIETQSKQTLANWALDYSENLLLPLWSQYYPDDPRPKLALDAARDWLKGTIKLPAAKEAILACHAAARDAAGNAVAQGCARAIGQSASTIHSAKHCAGLAFYGALAMAYEHLGINQPWDKIEKYAAEECGRMEEALRSVSVRDEPNPVNIDWKC